MWSLASSVSAATLSPEANAAELVKNYQTRIKNKETERANALRSLVSDINAQIAVVNKEQADKLKGLTDAKQVAAIRQSYAASVAKLKSQQGVQTKQINDRLGKELNDLRAELKAVQTQNQIERRGRERDLAKNKQEKAKKLKAAPSSAELQKMKQASEVEAEKKLKAAQAKRLAEQAVWKSKNKGQRVILDLVNGN